MKAKIHLNSEIIPFKKQTIRIELIHSIKSSKITQFALYLN